MEKTVLKDQSLNIHENVEFILYLGAGVLCAFLPLRFQYLLLFPLLGYGYLHNRKAIWFFLFSAALFLFALRSATAYLTVLGIVIFFLLVQCAAAISKRMPLWLCALLIAMQLPFALYGYALPRAIGIVLLLGALYLEQYGKDGWLRNDWRQNDVLKSALIASLYFAVVCYAPRQAAIAAAITAVLLVMLCQGASGIWMSGVLAFMVSGFSLFPAFCALLLRVSKLDRKAALAGCLVLFTVDGIDAALLAAMLSMALLWFVQEQLRRRQEPVCLAIAQSEEKKQQMKRRLQNFAGIFHSMAQFYETQAAKEAPILEQMAEGVEQMAAEFVQGDTPIDEKQLKDILEGYRFPVRALKISVLREGEIKIEGVISKTSRQDVEGTLQPLLETLYRCSFALTYLEQGRRFSPTTHFLFTSVLQLQIEGAGASLAAKENGNGDTFSIFRHGAHTLCSISDGMGNGEKAGQSSSLITSIFQRMVVSDMEIRKAIQTINQLIHSDIYATLDVLCVNAHSGQAYLAKSAACPTLLIRQDRILQLSGRSLPLGILEEMQPDCFELQLQEGDELLMISDGIHPQEIRNWVETRTHGEVRFELEQLMEQLRQRVRTDDSTAVLLRVSKRQRKHG